MGQWGIGLGIDRVKAAGLTEVRAFQVAMAVFLTCCVAANLHFVVAKSHNQCH